MAIRTHAGLPLAVRGVRAVCAERGCGPRQVLDVCRFRVDGGSQAAIYGPSGSGKTTLLNLFAALERPGHGSVRWGEVEITTLPERVADVWRRETVGLLFQHFQLFPGLSALENVLLPLRFDRWSIDPDLRARALRLLERVGVHPDSEANSLSRGELKRVAIARAVLRRPAIVLADEPTAGLDRDAANVVADLLCSMCRSVNTTLVVATPDPSLASRLDLAFDLVGGDLRAQTPAGARHRLRSAA